MISREEYLKAKAIVEQYEKEEFEEGCRIADEELEFEPVHDCWACGGTEDEHMYACPEDNSPYALLVREGYD